MAPILLNYKTMFLFKSKITILLVLICLAAQVSADPKAPGQRANELIAQLVGSGTTNIGAIDLVQLGQEMSGIQWNLVDGGIPKPPSQGPGLSVKRDRAGHESFVSGVEIPEYQRPYRSSARFNTSSKTVWLKEYIEKGVSPESEAQLELHEALGALGYNDNQYMISSSLSFLNQTKDLTVRKSLVDQFGRTLFKSDAQISYGGSSVGGGGDLTSIEIKRQVLGAIRSRGKTITMDFLANYMSIAFEPMSEEQNQSVYVRYYVHLKDHINSPPTLAGVREDLPYEELITINYPKAIWEKSPSQRKKIIRFIAYGIQSLFPAYADTPVELFADITGCKSKRLAVPVDRSANADLVLRFRAYMLSTCNRHSDSAGFGRQNQMMFEVDMPR